MSDDRKGRAKIIRLADVRRRRQARAQTAQASASPQATDADITAGWAQAILDAAQNNAALSHSVRFAARVRALAAQPGSQPAHFVSQIARGLISLPLACRRSGRDEAEVLHAVIARRLPVAVHTVGSGRGGDADTYLFECEDIDEWARGRTGGARHGG